MTDQVVVLHLFYQARPTMVGNRLRNVAYRVADGTNIWNAHEWDV